MRRPVMRRIATRTNILAMALLGTATVAPAAHAGSLGNSSSYNTPFGMSSSTQQNQAIDPSLRDSNGNLTMVNGQFTSSAFAQSYGIARAPSMGSPPGASSGSGAGFGGATAIGNQLNVVTVGNNNTVV